MVNSICIESFSGFHKFSPEKARLGPETRRCPQAGQARPPNPESDRRTHQRPVKGTSFEGLGLLPRYGTTRKVLLSESPPNFRPNLP